MKFAVWGTFFPMKHNVDLNVSSLHYLEYAKVEAVFGQTFVSITVELVDIATSSSPSSHPVLSLPSTSCSSSGFPAVGCDSGGPAGEPDPGDPAEAGDVGEAGEAGETGEGGDVGEVGEGGVRGGDGGGGLTCTTLSKPSSASEGPGAAGGSGLFSDVLVRSSSWATACFWAGVLTSY